MSENQQKLMQLQQIKIKNITFNLKENEDAHQAFALLDTLNPESILEKLVVNNISITLSIKHATHLNNTQVETTATTRKGNTVHIYNQLHLEDGKIYVIKFITGKVLENKPLTVLTGLLNCKLNETVECDNYTVKCVKNQYFKPITYITCFLNENRKVS